MWAERLSRHRLRYPAGMRWKTHKAPTTAAEYGVLMVCMGNICRSPTAEAALRHRLQLAGLADRVRVDSAGTHGYHVGAPPDARAQAHARARGLDLSGLRARRVLVEDFSRFDLVLAMDHENLGELHRLCPPEQQNRVKLLMSFARLQRDAQEVPDPYYGSEQGFERVLDLVSDACDGLAGVIGRLLAAPGHPSTT
jgi:protein-tyrosine phosphatase